jgi:hypothetical protein
MRWKPLNYYPGDREVRWIAASVVVFALVVIVGLFLLALHYV